MKEHEVFFGDCLDVMPTLAPSSIDLILTSPPYDGLREYGSGAEFDFCGVAAQCLRVLAPGGVLVWVVNDQSIDGDESGTSFRQALHFKTIGLRLYDTMIYAKMNPVPMNHPRYEQAFEFMFVLSKGRPKTVNLIREPCRTYGKRLAGDSHRRRSSGTGDRLVPMHGRRQPVSEDKARSNIWTYSNDAKRIGHPAVFPLPLATDHVLSWSNPGDLVLDPFVGSGTTVFACQNTGRRCIGIEKDRAIYEKALRRLERPHAPRPRPEHDEPTHPLFASAAETA